MDGSLCCRNYGIPGLGGESSARPHPLSLAIPRLTLGLLFVACLSIVTISVTGPFVSLLFCLWSERVIVEVPLFGRTITSRYLFDSNTIESEICCSLTTGLFVAFMAVLWPHPEPSARTSAKAVLLFEFRSLMQLYMASVNSRYKRSQRDSMIESKANLLWRLRLWENESEEIFLLEGITIDYDLSLSVESSNRRLWSIDYSLLVKLRRIIGIYYIQHDLLYESSIVNVRINLF